MKVTIIKNGTIRMVLSPENDSDLRDLEVISKLETQMVLTKSSMAVLDTIIPEGSIIIQSSKTLGNKEQV